MKAPLALALLAGLLLPQAAQAHAELVATAPARGARPAEAPRAVTLRFNEPVEASFGAVRVFDAEGERVNSGPVVRPADDPERVAVRLNPGLGDGTYTATYRVISADAHPVAGGFVFSVGDPGAAPSVTVAGLIDEGNAGSVTSAAFGTARALSYLAIAMAVGGTMFFLAAWLPGLRAASGADAAWRDSSEAFCSALWTPGGRHRRSRAGQRIGRDRSARGRRRRPAAALSARSSPRGPITPAMLESPAPAITLTAAEGPEKRVEVQRAGAAINDESGAPVWVALVAIALGGSGCWSAGSRFTDAKHGVYR